MTPPLDLVLETAGGFVAAALALLGLLLLAGPGSRGLS